MVTRIERERLVPNLLFSNVKKKGLSSLSEANFISEMIYFNSDLKIHKFTLTSNWVFEYYQIY